MQCTLSKILKYDFSYLPQLSSKLSHICREEIHASFLSGFYLSFLFTQLPFTGEQSSSPNNAALNLD